MELSSSPRVFSVIALRETASLPDEDLMDVLDLGAR